MKRTCLVLLFAAACGPAMIPSSAAAELPPARAFEIPPTDEGLPGTGPIRRYDWFRNLWRERRAQWAADAAQDQGAIVLLGDSITQGWWDVGSLFPGVKFANRGISGDTTRGVLIRLQEDVLKLKPRAVVLLIGTNDLEEWGSPEAAAGNLQLIIAALEAHNASMPVVLCKVMPSSLSNKRPANQIQKMNELYLQVVADRPQVTVLDTWSLFADVKGEAPLEQFPDLLHPNAIGYARWAAALRPVLETLGLVPAMPDHFSPEPGFVALNTADLSGWTYEGAALEGKRATADHRYVAANGRLVVTAAHPPRTYKRIETVRTFPRDFVLKLEFRATPAADSGIFVRGLQLQCRDYLLAGPFAHLQHYRPLDWNEIVITVEGGLAHATCNGEVLVDAMAVPADGTIGLESDRGQVEYRRLRVQEAK